MHCLIRRTPDYDFALLSRMGSEADRRVGVSPILRPPGLGAGLDLLLAFGVCPLLARPLGLPDSVRVCACCNRDAGGGVGSPSLHGIFSMSQPHQVLASSSRCRSSRLRSKAERYRSYASRNPRSTREENMSSPRGLVVCGIVWRVVEAADTRPPGLGARVGDIGRDGGSEGRGKKNESGFKGNLERNGGLRTLRYMFRDRRALFA